LELRNEIIESEKARADLFKWKIVLVASLGAIALGLESALGGEDAATKDPPITHTYVLCLIPLVCLYVDLLCSHLNLRIMVIGRYFQSVAARGDGNLSADDVRYEEFAERARNLTSALVRRGRRILRKRRPTNGLRLNVFAFEDLAQHVSSIVLSSFVIAWGWPGIPASWLGLATCSKNPGRWVFVGSGLVGVMLSAFALWRYRRRLAALCGLVEALKDESRNEAPAEAAIV
jgi:hypothetical protein